MRVRLIWTGKTRDTHLKALICDYLERLSHFTRCEVTELRESGDKREKMGIDKDSRRISDALRSGGTVVLLDEGGTQLTSIEVASQIQSWQGKGTKEVTFVVGTPNGVSKELFKRADHHWSLSRLTLTHEMARVLLVEQLYRAYTIIHGLPYQK